MKNSAMRDALSLFYALHDYLVDKPELTEADKAVMERIQADMGISCDDSLDEQILRYQSDLNMAKNDQEKGVILENVISLLS